MDRLKNIIKEKLKDTSKSTKLKLSQTWIHCHLEDNEVFTKIKTLSTGGGCS